MNQLFCFNYIKTCLICLMVFCTLRAFGQVELDNQVFDNRVHTVQLMKDGTDDRYPIITLNSSEQLRLSFDMFALTNEYFQYTVVHCNANWQPTGMAQNLYLKGMSFDNITDFKFSTNTFTKYTHYNVVFPNENMKPMIAGNYIIKVFRNFDEEQQLLTRRFMILNSSTLIEAVAKPATLAEYRFTKQELNFTIEYNTQQIANPLADVKVVILQNNRWDNALRGLTPQFANGNKLDYNYFDRTLFNGGNEYRFFDTRQLRGFSPNVRTKITDSVYRAILNTDEPRSSLQYVLWMDYNGKRVIQNREGGGNQSGAIDGDYAWVTFYLGATSALPEGAEVYVFGEFTDWKLRPECQMRFNSRRNRYDLEIPLKQGRYEYSYAIANPGNRFPDETIIEGNHSQTENEYLILVYTRNLQYNYDELIGARKINTVSP